MISIYLSCCAVMFKVFEVYPPSSVMHDINLCLYVTIGIQYLSQEGKSLHIATTVMVLQPDVLFTLLSVTFTAHIKDER